MDAAERKLLSLRSGFLKRPPEAGQPVRNKARRREFRSSAEFALTYASMTIALRLTSVGYETFPDNYCLERSSTRNWYYVTRQPSLRAARRMVAMGLDNPGLVANPIPDTIRALAYRHNKLFDMLMIASREGSSFPKPGIACCYAGRYYHTSLLEESVLCGTKLFRPEDRRIIRSPLAYGAELFNRIRASSRQIKSVTKGLVKRGNQI